MDKKKNVRVLIFDKVDFKIKDIVRDKEHYIMRKETIQQEDITLLNIYDPI